MDQQIVGASRSMELLLSPVSPGSKFEYTPPKPLPKPIPPVDPRSASADTDISREVGDNLLLPLNCRNN